MKSGNNTSLPISYPGDPANPEYRDRCILMARLKRSLKPLENADLKKFVETIEDEVPRLINFPP